MISGAHTHASPRTPRVRQKSPRRGGTDRCRIDAQLYEEISPVTRLLDRTREVAMRAGPSQSYRVDLDRVPDAAALLGWIEHLAAKNWCKPQHIRELILIAERENGIDIDRAA